jgi:hypothetical protein
MLCVLLCSCSGVQAAAGTAQQAAEVTIRVLATPFTSTKTRSRLPPTTTGKAITRAAPASPAPSTLQGAAWHAYSDQEIDSLEPREYDHLTPIHLKTPPPDPWTVQPKRRVATFEEKMVHSLVTGRGGAPASSGRLRGRASASVSLQHPQVSGTSAGQQRTITAGRGMSGTTPLRDAHDGSTDTGHDVKLEERNAAVAPILRKGYITNPLTGRQIKVCILLEIEERVLGSGNSCSLRCRLQCLKSPIEALKIWFTGCNNILVCCACCPGWRGCVQPASGARICA